MAKNNATIRIGSDTKEAESAIKKVTGQLNKLVKATDFKSFSNLGGAFSIATTALKGISGAIKGAVAAMEDLSQAANVQIKAETLLETAAKNNPYMDDYSVQKLKNYAGQLQKISTYGDEQLLPLMAQLSASGRDTAQTQQIMSAAINLAASGTMSLESAVKNLNKSYSGTVGELANSVPSLKNLTSEQLKNGEAVKIVANQYKGMAQSVANTTGASQQLSNAIGDLKENAGRVINFFLNPFKKMLTTIVSGVNELWDKARIAMAGGEEAVATTLESKLDLYKTQLAELEAQLKALPEKYKEAGQAASGYSDEIQQAQKNLEEAQKRGDSVLANMYKTQLANLQAEAKRASSSEELQKATVALVEAHKNENEEIKKQIENKKALIAQTEKQIKDKAYQEKLDEETQKIQKQQKAYEEKIKTMKTEASLRGEEVDALQIVNEKIALYMAVLKESGDYAKTFLVKLQSEIKNDLKKINGLKFDTSQLEGLNIGEQIEKYKAFREVLLNLQRDLDPQSEAFKRLAQSIKNVDLAIKDLKSRSKDWDDLSTMQKLEFASKQVQSLVTSFNSASQLLSETIENEAKADTANLETEYAKGLISEEEYYDKKESLEKEAAKKKYKIQMAEWALNLLATQSANALAIANSLKKGGSLGMIEAAIMAVQTATQLASQIASKPIPPSFATGGVVGGFSGASIGEDNTYIHARRGEMMLNARQQKNLYDIANSSSRPFSNNIYVKNEAGESVKAQAAIGQSGVEITIKKIVNDAIASGEFNNSFQTMKANIYGRRITN
ncbi:coiled-coil domain-containing protein [Treponema pectinovorum]|uniref:hypothetical protein n=1 Tax=Treponema pectinovorum TaxID=164 RepID=UPI0011CB7639|nr:hypothetical protein [Treponema pectinovorum]